MNYQDIYTKAKAARENTNQPGVSSKGAISVAGLCLSLDKMRQQQIVARDRSGAESVRYK